MAEVDAWADVLSEEQRRLWPHAASVANQVGAILMGGTAVAIHLRHRRSVDFNLMTLTSFSGRAVERSVRGFARRIILRDVSRNCFHAVVDGVEWDVFRALRTEEVEPHQMTVLAPGPEIDGIRIGSIPDLLATKLDVINYRAKLRDYIDIAAIDQLTAHRLEDGIGYYCHRFGYSHVPRVLDRSLALLRRSRFRPTGPRVRGETRRGVRASLAPRPGSIEAPGPHEAPQPHTTRRALTGAANAPLRQDDAPLPQALHPPPRPQRPLPQPLTADRR